MRRRTTVIATVLFMLVPTAAFADQLRLDDDGKATADKEESADGEPEAAEPVGGSGPSNGGGQAPPTTTIRTYVPVGDGTYCEGSRQAIIPDHQTEQEVQEIANRAFFQAYDRTDPDAWDGDCPFETGGDPVPMVTGEDVLVTLQDQLPRPEPTIDPGFGLAGLRMYLETGRPLTYANTTTVSVGEVAVGIEIDASATYMVDWGDGNVTGPYDTPGEGYPDGTVTHVYTDVGSYDVEVIDTWQVRWRFTGQPDWNEITGELRPVPLADFEVTERRAVRTR